eukprot:scaffold172801_cov32-Tisochrysis_lutea.AAC.2
MVALCHSELGPHEGARAIERASECEPSFLPSRMAFAALAVAFMLAIIAAPDAESAEAWIRQQAHDHRVLERAMRRYEMRADGSVEGVLDGPTGLDADLMVPDFDDTESAATWLHEQQRRHRKGVSTVSESVDDLAAEKLQREEEDLLRATHNDFDAAQLW